MMGDDQTRLLLAFHDFLRLVVDGQPFASIQIGSEIIEDYFLLVGELLRTAVLIETVLRLNCLDHLHLSL